MNKKIRYASVCSGIGAESQAWADLGWFSVFFSEIDPFASACLQAKWPKVPNLGDMTQIEGKKYRGTIDLICGGTPCQAFSVAGRREGMDDPRGQLAIKFVELLADIRPRWFVWENVPGVLSSKEGYDFGSFLGCLTGRKIDPPSDGWRSAGIINGIPSAYGVAWRCLDAQYFGVPQRRNRVFVVGYLGDWRPPSAVLFEQDSVCRNPTQSRDKARRKVAATLKGGSGARGFPLDFESGLTVCTAARALTTKPRLDCSTETFVVHGTQDPIVGSIAHTLGCNQGQENAVVYGFSTGHSAASGSIGAQEQQSPTLCSTQGGNRIPAVAIAGEELIARRLTPVECERLQGFPDNYTKILFKGKTVADCHRYKALGNSMAVPVIRWIGNQIQLVEELDSFEQYKEAIPF